MTRNSPRPLEVIALDPGEKVGWARASISPAGDWEDLNHGINHLKDMALGLAKNVHKYDVVIYETFRLYPHKARQQIGSDFPTAQFVGMVRLLAWMNPEIRLIAQGPNIKETARKTAPDWLQEVLANEPKAHDDAHNVDALLHLWLWTWRNYIAKEAA